MIQFASVCLRQPTKTARRRAASCFFWGCLSALVGLWASPVSAGPQLDRIEPRGLRIGHATTVVLRGSGLDGSTRVEMPLGAQVSSSVLAVSDEGVQLQVRVASSIAPGIYPLRVVTSSGISNPWMVGVDALRQEPHDADRVWSLPVALHGTLKGDQVVRTQFHGRSGQRLVIDLEGRRLGSQVRPLLQLNTPDGRQFATARPQRRLAQDVRMDVVLPSDGIYELQLRDIIFKGPLPGWFRLKLGNLSYADLAFPLSVAATETGQIRLISTNLPATFARAQTVGFEGLHRPIQWPHVEGLLFSGAFPWVRVSTLGAREWREDQLPSTEPLQPPFAINGQLLDGEAYDQFAIATRPGSSLNVDLFAARWNSALDARIELLAATDPPAPFAAADDQPGTADPELSTTITHDASHTLLRIGSLLDDRGPDHAYRVVVRDRESPETRITMDVDHVNVPSGGRVVLPLQVAAQGKRSDIQLKLPATLRSAATLSPATIWAYDEQPLIAIAAVDGVRGVFPMRIPYSAPRSPETSPGYVRGKSFPGSGFQPHWESEIMLSVIPSRALRIDWAAERATDQLVRGTDTRLHVAVTRPASGGKVRLTLLTSQSARTKKVDDKDVADTDRMLRIDETILDRDGLVPVTIRVPADLPVHDWSIAIRAELLSEDQQRVVQSADTTVRRLPTVAPFDLRMAAADRSVAAGGDALVLAGQIARNPSFPMSLRIRLDGLSESDPMPEAVVSAAHDAFELSIVFPATAEAREISNVRVVVEPAEPDEHNRGMVIRSDPFKLTITK